MKRRNFLNGVAAATVGSMAGFRLPIALAANYGGKFLVSIQANGGWDPTCFCDPKINTPGEPIINHWAETGEVRTAGNVSYAPFADNEAFFEKYHDRMLVINGVDAQTNAHDIGTVHTWTGRSTESFPTLSAVHAAHHAPDAQLACISFQAYTKGGGLLSVTDLNNVAGRQLATLINPSLGYLPDEDWANIRRVQAETAARLKAVEDLMPAERRNLSVYEAAFAAEGLREFMESVRALPPNSPKHTAIAAFKTGVSVSADFVYAGFDTHSDNDERQSRLLANLTAEVNGLWELAEESGIADRLVVVIGSEFGRTNHYNSNDGKDHWPISSIVVMEKNQLWSDRVVAATDELHFAHPVNPKTLRRDGGDGLIMYPKHVHQALRRYLDLGASRGARLYPFRDVEEFAFFEA